MLQFISTLLTQFRREDEEGQTLVEYGLLLALIAIIVIVALIFLGPIVSQIFQNVGDQPAGHVSRRRRQRYRSPHRTSGGGFGFPRAGQLHRRTLRRKYHHRPRPEVHSM